MTKVIKSVFNASTATVFADNTNEDISEGDFRNKFGDVSDSAAFLEEVNTFSKQQRFKKGADVASATVLPLVSDGNSFDVTGTVTVTSFADLGGTGTEINLHFDGILTLTHHATNLILPTGANIITAAGDHATFINYASGDYRCINYQRASGAALSSSTVVIDDSALIVVPQTNLQDFADGVDHALLKARGTGVNTTYVSSVSVGGTTFAQPEVFGEIKSDEGYFDVHYTGATGVTVATLSATSTYVYIDNAGSLQQQTTIPTRQDWSRKIFTMRIGVNTSTNVIIGFEYLNNPLGNYTNSLRDVYSYLLAQGVPFKKEMDITGRVADLGFDVASGSFLEFGGTGDIDNPNINTFDAATNVSYNLMSRTALVSSETNLLKFWDNATTITALGSTTCVGHRLYRFSSGNFALQYGQGNYANMSLAKTGAKLEEYVLNPALKDAVFLGWWLLEETATATSGTVDAEFVEYTIGIQGGSSSSLSGALLKGNNLSDVLDASTARTNLGAGDVSKVGTPVDNQVGVWTGDGTIEGDDGLTYDGITLSVNNTIYLTGGTVANKPTLAGFNHTTKQWEVAANGTWDFQGNALTNFTGGGLSNVVEDTTPQLGGDLDLNSSDITGTGGINITGSITASSSGLFSSNKVRVGALTTGAGNNASGTINTASVTTGAVAGDGANFIGIVPTGYDSGTVPVIQMSAYLNLTTAIATRPVFGLYNYNTILLEVDNDGTVDFQGNALTNFTGAVLDTATVYETLWIDAAAMVPRSTNGAQAGSRELPTNDVMIDYLAFDKDTDEYAQFKVSLPDQLTTNPEILFQAYWTAESGSGTVSWDFQARALSNSDALESTWSALTSIATDTLITANDVHIATSGGVGITLSGAVGNDLFIFEVNRDTSEDTLGVDAQLLGVKIQYPVNNTATTVWS